MAIGVFIAPILLYWEALSSDDPGIASASEGNKGSRLWDPQILTPAAIRRLNQK
jgi:hypothetical protein